MPDGKYSFADDMASAGTTAETRRAMRRKMLRTQRNIQRRTAKVLGKVPVRHAFRKELLRLREIEKIIRHRFGLFLPEIDADGVFHGEAYLHAVAAAIHASGSKDVLSDLQAWCSYIAPFLLNPDYLDPMADAVASVRHRTFDLRSDAVARLLGITLDERLALGLKTVGACDCSPADLRKIMKDRKMVADRERIAEKRKAQGRQRRAEYLEANPISRLKPWEAEGISRRTWYRRQKADTGVSRIEDSKDEMCDTLVPSPQIELQPRKRHSLKEKGNMQRDVIDTRREAKRSEAEGREPYKANSEAIPLINAVFDALRGPWDGSRMITGNAPVPWRFVNVIH
ncbi:hypothetical protein [Mesorhizobium sp. IMUNJ 23232]|uniref:hypothetical protein n=1 Tax=Mesorhizobium sp. IMUNJ 23232 TaxID=3376064 RepID=UPI0037B444F8